MITAAALALATGLQGGGDPRPQLIELGRSGHLQAELGRVESLLGSDPEVARRLGLDFLHADLLERSGRLRDAAEAFAQTLSSRAGLSPWSRLRLAIVQERLGHPEVAAGLVATLLAGDPPETLIRRGFALLDRTLARGGDCRLLRGLQRDHFAGAARRARDLLEIRCLTGGPEGRDALPLVRDFLAAGTSDAMAWDAAATSIDHPSVAVDRSLALLLGLTAYQHREFEISLRLLRPWTREGPEGPFDNLGRDATYAVARSLFWLGRYPDAAREFGRIASESTEIDTRSDAFHQQGRALELDGDLSGALVSFDRAYREAPAGEWAGAALLSALRLEYLSGNADAARRRLTTLAGSPALASATARGALFIAVSEIEQGRTDRVLPLLDLATRTGETSAEEVSYWRGRIAESSGDLERALDAYLATSAERPFHPLAEAAASRLHGPALATAVARRLESLRERKDAESRRQLSRLAATEADRASWRAEGLAQLAAGRTTAPWVSGGPVPVAEWPLWDESLHDPEDLLLALGLAGEAPGAVLRRFPAGPTRAGLTGATLLSESSAARAGIGVAESIFDRRPRQVPLDWVATDWLRALYPLPWRDLIRDRARAFGVEPALLAAVIREESRFDPEALSAAAARGLTQFVLPTARRLAPAAGVAALDARDLFLPQVSIPLGAAYLAQLGKEFKGNPIAIAAAYNAGESQTSLWLRSCFSAEPEELLAKIGFGETRSYVTRVLQSRNAYRKLWLPVR